MLSAPTLRSWVYQCLGDCSQSSPGSRRHGGGGEAHGEEEEMPGVKKGAVKSGNGKNQESKHCVTHAFQPCSEEVHTAHCTEFSAD